MKNAYTLLADDSLPTGSQPSHEAVLRAHLVLGALSNTTIMLSDNQVVNSLNVRQLLNKDDTVRDLVSEGILTFAIRGGIDEFDGTPADARLDAITEAFRREGKFLLSDAVAQDRRAFDLIGTRGRMIEWTYGQVRENYTRTCKSLLFDARTRAVLGDAAHDTLRNAIEEEDARDAGLGRAYLQLRLPDDMANRGHRLSPVTEEYLRNCILAPYLSNLPSVTGHNPIYEQQHQPSFDLMRGVNFRYEDIEAPKRLFTKLDTQHFIEGLSRLRPDDIMRIREHPAFRRFINLSSTTSLGYSGFLELRQAFSELTIVIDDSIYTRFPELALSTTDERRDMRTRVAVANRSIGVCLDVLGLFVSIPGLGTIMSISVDMLRRKFRADDSAIALREEGERRIFESELRQRLAAEGNDAKISAVEEVVETNSHDWETMVAVQGT